MDKPVNILLEIDDLDRLGELFPGAVEAWWKLATSLPDTQNSLQEVQDDSVFFVGTHRGRIFLGVKSCHDEASFTTVMYWHAAHGWCALPVG